MIVEAARVVQRAVILCISGLYTTWTGVILGAWPGQTTICPGRAVALATLTDRERRREREGDKRQHDTHHKDECHALSSFPLHGVEARVESGLSLMKLLGCFFGNLPFHRA